MGVTERCRLAAGTAPLSALRFVLALPAADVGVGERFLPTQHPLKMDAVLARLQRLPSATAGSSIPIKTLLQRNTQ